MQKWAAHRRLLPTLLASHPEGLRDRLGRKFFPTLTASERGGRASSGKRGASLGRGLNPRWCEWFMGFPEDWTLLDEELSVTPSSRSVRKSSAE
jgi:hypothetical protein